jgi:hypothetical protein
MATRLLICEACRTRRVGAYPAVFSHSPSCISSIELGAMEIRDDSAIFSFG